MQLGTRWLVGEAAPARLPAPVAVAVREVEAGLDGVDTTGWRWTLTWLEDNAVVELDDGTLIRYVDGNVVVLEPEPPQDD